jgi:hypothetical protein
LDKNAIKESLTGHIGEKITPTQTILITLVAESFAQFVELAAALETRSRLDRNRRKFAGGTLQLQKLSEQIANLLWKLDPRWMYPDPTDGDGDRQPAQPKLADLIREFAEAKSASSFTTTIAPTETDRTQKNSASVDPDTVPNRPRGSESEI